MEVLDQLLGGGEYYRFPSFEVALYSLLLSFVLSAAIGLTYKLTYKGEFFPLYFFQAIVLSSTVSSMVIMAVGNNLAAGFGIIGAIAIIRFRTLIRNPRNIIFIFASLSVGIATGVYGYSIALAGTSIFCLSAVLLHYSPIERFDRTAQVLQFVTNQIDEDNGALVQFFKSNQIRYRHVQTRQLNNTKGYRMTFRLSVPTHLKPRLFQDITEIGTYSDVRLSSNDEIEL